MQVVVREGPQKEQGEDDQGREALDQGVLDAPDLHRRAVFLRSSARNSVGRDSDVPPERGAEVPSVRVAGGLRDLVGHEIRRRQKLLGALHSVVDEIVHHAAVKVALDELGKVARADGEADGDLLNGKVLLPVMARHVFFEITDLPFRNGQVAAFQDGPGIFGEPQEVRPHLLRGPQALHGKLVVHFQVTGDGGG